MFRKIVSLMIFPRKNALQSINFRNFSRVLLWMTQLYLVISTVTVPDKIYPWVLGILSFSMFACCFYIESHSNSVVFWYPKSKKERQSTLVHRHYNFSLRSTGQAKHKYVFFCMRPLVLYKRTLCTEPLPVNTMFVLHLSVIDLYHYYNFG